MFNSDPSIKQFARKFLEWKENPCKFVAEVFHAEPDRWQEEALKAFADPKKARISLQACAGPGKSTVLAWCGWNFLLCYGEPDHHPNAAAMSVTVDNLKNNLWKEFSVWYQRSLLLKKTFLILKEKIFAVEAPSTWFLSARSWSKTADPEEQGRALSGLHSKYILYLVDESGDINPSILRVAEQGLSNCAWGKIIQAGNPTSLDGMLYLAAEKQRHLWHIIRITGDPETPDSWNRSPRILKERPQAIVWAKEQIELYGKDNPWVKALILGEFPQSSLNTLLGYEEVEMALRRNVLSSEYEYAQKRIGIDAARFGNDCWVLFPRQGLQAFKPVSMRNVRSHEVAARVALAKSKWHSEVEFFDDTGGYAAGAIDSLIQAGHDPIPINFSSKAADPRYFNKRSEMWFRMADWIKRGGALPDCSELIAELTTPTYTFHNGKFRLEEKDQIKQRLGRSPNYADALALTFALPEMPSSFEAQLEELGINPAVYTENLKTKNQYDPLNNPPRSEYDPLNS